MSLESVSTAQLATIPAAPPPPGVVPNFVNPESCGPEVITALAVSSAVMCVFVGLRLYTRIWIVGSMGWDDYTTVAATIGSLAYVGLLAHAFKNGLGIHQWNVSALKFLSMIKEFRAINYLFPPFMFLAKLALCLLFFRVFSPNRTMRWLIYFAIAYNFMLHFAGAVIGIFLCLSGGAEFIACSHKMTTLDIVFSGMNIFSDFYLLILPIFGVSRLQMHTAQKVGIIAVFLTGSFACVASILGVIYIVQHGRSPDKTWNVASVLILAVLEIEITIVVGCLPVVPAFFRQKKLVSLSLGSWLFRRSLHTPDSKEPGSSSSDTAPKKNGKVAWSGRSYDRIEKGSDYDGSLQELT